MDPLEPILTRRSVRRYRPDPVPRALLERVLEAGRWAPTGMNLQPWEFIVVTDQEVRRAVARHARYYVVRSYYVSDAPVLIAVCGHPLRSPMYLADCIFAGAMMLVAANALGLATCWIGGFREDKVKEILDVPAGVHLVGLITLGYADHPPNCPPKRELAEIVHWEAYGSAPKVSPLKLARQSGPLSVLVDLILTQLRLR